MIYDAVKLISVNFKIATFKWNIIPLACTTGIDYFVITLATISDSLILPS